MAKAPAAKKGQKTQDFIVKEGCRIGGFDGKVKNGGDAIALTKEQAEFYIERELVKPQMPDFDEDDTNDSGDGAGNTTPDEKQAKAEGGSSTESGAKAEGTPRI